MATTLTNTSIEIVSNLIRKEFEQVDFSMDYIYNRAEKLIATAKDLGLNELAAEMSDDLKTVA